MSKHELLLTLVKTLPTDYADNGGVVERWKDEGKLYADCSGGCRHFLKLAGDLGYDWGDCANPLAPRAGLLTFEHQAGHECFELE